MLVQGPQGIGDNLDGVRLVRFLDDRLVQIGKCTPGLFQHLGQLRWRILLLAQGLGQEHHDVHAVGHVSAETLRLIEQQRILDRRQVALVDGVRRLIARPRLQQGLRIGLGFFVFDACGFGAIDGGADAAQQARAQLFVRGWVLPEFGVVGGEHVLVLLIDQQRTELGRLHR